MSDGNALRQVLLYKFSRDLLTVPHPSESDKKILLWIGYNYSLTYISVAYAPIVEVFRQ